MTNRREFLQTGAAVSAFAINGVLPAHAAGAAAARSGAQLHALVYDDRYAESELFAATMRQQGVAARALMDGDVTGLWHDDFERQWRSDAPIAGFTQDGPLLVFQQLARDRRMRLIFRVEHRPGEDGTLTHAITAPQETMTLIRTVGVARLAWPELFAAAACRCSAHSGPSQTFALTTSGPPPALQTPRAADEPSFIHYYTPRRLQQGYGVDMEGPLNTWVFAPISGA